MRHAYSPSVYQLTPYSNLQQAANLMLFSGQTSFPVTQGEQLVGFISQGTLMTALRARGPHTWVNMVMRQDVPPVRLTDDLYEVAQRMQQEGVDALPVADADGRSLGMVTQQNIVELRRLQRVAPHAVPKPYSA